MRDGIVSTMKMVGMAMIFSESVENTKDGIASTMKIIWLAMIYSESV